jgi:hypothetical protein
MEEILMRTRPIFLALALLVGLLPTQWAAAQANYRSAVDRQCKQAQSCQEKQNQRFKAIEREAERLLQDVAGRKVSFEIAPSGNRSRQRP